MLPLLMEEKFLSQPHRSSFGLTPPVKCENVKGISFEDIGLKHRMNSIVKKAGKSAAGVIDTEEFIVPLTGEKIKIKNEPGICKRRR